MGDAACLCAVSQVEEFRLRAFQFWAEAVHQCSDHVLYTAVPHSPLLLGVTWEDLRYSLTYWWHCLNATHLAPHIELLRPYVCDHDGWVGRDGFIQALAWIGPVYNPRCAQVLFDALGRMQRAPWFITAASTMACESAVIRPYVDAVLPRYVVAPCRWKMQSTTWACPLVLTVMYSPTHIIHSGITRTITGMLGIKLSTTGRVFGFDVTSLLRTHAPNLKPMFSTL
jgi:hypothetical protein